MVHNETSKRFVEGVASKPLITIFGQISNSLSNQCAALCNLCLEYSVIALSCPHPAVAKSDVKITKDHSTEIDHASSLKSCDEPADLVEPCLVTTTVGFYGNQLRCLFGSALCYMRCKDVFDGAMRTLTLEVAICFCHFWF